MRLLEPGGEAAANPAEGSSESPPRMLVESPAKARRREERLANIPPEVVRAGILRAGGAPMPRPATQDGSEDVGSR